MIGCRDIKPYNTYTMTLHDRDRSITQFISKFNQSTSSTIYKLIFDGTGSHTSCDRALGRLVGSGHLRRIERRAVGGSRGGSGQYVYSLGLAGHQLYRAGRYIPARAINYHSLAIVEAFETLTMRSRAGNFGIAGYTTEPDCHVTIGSYELKPDLYVELERPGGSARFWLEIDMGSQGQAQIKGKFQRYWHAYNSVSADDWQGAFPLVMFVAVDKERAAELSWLLKQGPTEAAVLFRVTTLAELWDIQL